jgi:hypothetical protein
MNILTRVVIATLVPMMVGSGLGASLQVKTLAVPIGLLGVADTTPDNFAEYLADLSVPAGLELRQMDLATMKIKRVIDRRSNVPGDGLVDPFNSAHSDYRASIADGVFVIRPLRRRAEYLDAGAPAVQLQVKGIMSAAKRVFSPLDPNLSVVGSNLMSGLGGIDLEHVAKLDNGFQVIPTDQGAR